MTRDFQFFRPVFILLLFISIMMISSCEKVKPDPCDDTVKSEKAVTIHVINASDNPVPDEAIKFTIYKTPCGAESKGHFEYNGVTSSAGTWTSPVVGYNLRNSEDDVYALVVATELENFFGQNFASATFKYNDFGISQKEVHLYIYSEDQD